MRLAAHISGVSSPPHGQPVKDIAALQAAVSTRPDDARGWYDLGCALGACGRWDSALHAIDCALTLVPGQPAALCERGVALAALRRLDEATESFEELLAVQPLNGFALISLGNLRFRQGRWDEAAAIWRQADRVSPEGGEALENLALALQRVGSREEEREVWRELLHRDPHHPAALHQLAALGELPAPRRASDAYLTRLFDAFSEDFDETLAGLGYQMPRLLAEAAREVVGEPAGSLDVLDAGCGTGLCAEWFRPWARHLTGVDVSAGMLDKARRRGGYDLLVRRELCAHLAEHRSSYDLIISSDTLNYFGSLEEVLGAATRSLRAGGFMVFSLEQARDDCGAAGYRLERHGRYSHCGDYLRNTVRRTGADLLRMDAGVMRYEAGEPVEAWVMVLRRPPRADQKTIAV